MEKMDPFRIDSYFNMQRYLPEEGFSSWHCEKRKAKTLNRILVWMVYLNTLTQEVKRNFYINTILKNLKKVN